MERRSSPLGPLVAVAGAALLLASLWLPWYEVRIPDALREAFRGFGSGAASGAPAGQAGGFGRLFEGLAAVIPDSIQASGWQVMEQADVALAVIASLALLIGIAAADILGLSVRADAQVTGRLTALLGAASLAIAGFHIVTRPIANFPGSSDFVDVRHGIWVAVLGSILMIGGGLTSASAQQGAASDSWTAGVPAEARREPAPGAASAAGTSTWIAPAAEPPADQTTPAPTPVYTAAPTTSTAPPGFTA